MIVKKETFINAMTSDGKVMVVGKNYVFEVTEGKCYFGVFDGFGKKGALKFVSCLDGKFLATFNIMPASVLSIYEAEINIVKDGE